MKQLLAAITMVFVASAASAGVMMEKTELDDAQIARVNELYPDDQSGTYGHYMWIRVGHHVISIQTDDIRFGKEQFKEKLKEKAKHALEHDAKLKTAFEILTSKGFSTQEAALLISLIGN